MSFIDILIVIVYFILGLLVSIILFSIFISILVHIIICIDKMQYGCKTKKKAPNYIIIVNPDNNITIGTPYIV